MKTISSFLFLFFTFGISLNLFASPDNCVVGNGDPQSFIKNCASGTIWVSTWGVWQIEIKSRVKSIAEKAIEFGGILAVGALVWAGIQYTTAYGEDEKLKHAKTTGIYAAIGLILLMAGFGLVDIFLNFIGVIGA